VTRACSQGTIAEVGDHLALARQARILFVDDDQDEVDTFLRLMHRLGLSADGCTSASEALSLAGLKDYSIFALDVCMPDMDGNVLASELGTLHPRATYLLVTGRSELDLPDRAMGAPAISGVILKPWDSTQLLAALARGQAAYEDRCAPEGSLAPAPRHARELPILLVEDNDGDAHLVETLLRDSDLTGLQVVRAKRLSDALRRVQEGEFSVVVTDLSLPDARGLDAVLRLRAVAPAMPIVILSGISDDALAVQAVKEGAQEILLKSELATSTLQRAIRRAAGRKAAAESLQMRAEQDHMTGLLARAQFEERLATALHQAHLESRRVCLMYIDLDRFKQVNDELGHAAGDDVLREAARRLRDALRAQDTAARLGGDEFAVLVEHLGSEEEAVRLGRRVIAELSRPYPLARPIAVTASVGLAFYPDDARSGPDLLARADQAMYRAKRSEGDGLGFSREQTGETALVVDDLDQAVAHWLDRGDVHTVTRPLFHSSTQADDLVEVEPEFDLGGLPLDAGTLRRFAATPQRARSLHEPLLQAGVRIAARGERRVLVSVSDMFCRMDGWLALLTRTASSCAAPRLCLGLPHQWLSSNLTHSTLVVEQLTSAGARVFVADFGAAGGDLLLLTTLPLAGVCLDGGLLRELSVDRRRALAFAQAVRTCAQALAMEFVLRAADRELCADLT
jgi:two-component system cell cycle response regulator